MKKRKRYPKLPNGYGSITYLGTNRRNPYAVYPPREYDEDGNPLKRKAICYTDDYLKGFAVLTAYKAGTYKPGDEREIKISADSNINSVISKLLSDYSQTVRKETLEAQDRLTFAEVYERFYDWKYDGKKEFSQSTKGATRSAYKNASALHTKMFIDIKYEDLQNVIDSCPKKHATLEHILNLFHQMYGYARAYEITDKRPDENVKIKIADDDESGVPFTIEQIQNLWNHRNDDIAQILIIMCYTGHRIGELKKATLNMENWSFTGGLKTQAGKNRIVPVHPAIQPIIKKRIKKYNCVLPEKYSYLRGVLKSYLLSIGIEKHTFHDCRHTFSMLCEKYNVSENDRKRMLGHAFKDVTNKIYGHRMLEDLRKEIEKIPSPDLLATC